MLSQQFFRKPGTVGVRAPLLCVLVAFGNHVVSRRRARVLYDSKCHQIGVLRGIEASWNCSGSLGQVPQARFPQSGFCRSRFPEPRFPESGFASPGSPGQVFHGLCFLVFAESIVFSFAFLYVPSWWNSWSTRYVAHTLLFPSPHWWRT